MWRCGQVERPVLPLMAMTYFSTSHLGKGAYWPILRSNVWRDTIKVVAFDNEEKRGSSLADSPSYALRFPDFDCASEGKT